MLIILKIDTDDAAVYGYPREIASRLYGKRIDDYALYHVLKKMNQRFIGEVRGITGIDAGLKAFKGKTIGIGMPLITKDGTYDGAILAIISPQLLVKQFMSLDQTRIMNTCWLIDESGTVVFHPDSSKIGKNVADFSPQGDAPFKMFSYTSKQYQKYSSTRMTYSGSTSLPMPHPYRYCQVVDSPRDPV